jgi:hypothetical protein
VTLDALTGAGYRWKFAGVTLEYLLEDQNQCTLVRDLKDSVQQIDLHWSPFTAHLYDVDEQLLWAHTEPFSVRDVDLVVFDRLLTLLHLAEHFVHDRFAADRTFADLVRAWNIWRAEVDVDKLLIIGRATDLHHALDYALGVAAEANLLEVPPPKIGSRRAARLRRLVPRPRPIREPDEVGKLLRLVLAPPRRAMREFRREVFPPSERLAVRYQRPPCAALRLRYPLRLLSPAHRKMRALMRRRTT